MFSGSSGFNYNPKCPLNKTMSRKRKYNPYIERKKGFLSFSAILINFTFL